MCHSFVIGDLVIDHTIFVRDSTHDHQPKGGEHIFKVLRRTDTAGGAANCARILAALSDGETYLWGITGRSHWGHFRGILSHAQAVDGSTKAIELRGVADETNAQMNTITRLIDERSGNPDGPLFADRFDEYRHLHVTPEKRRTVLHYLERACHKLEHQSKGHLDVIIINDLDYGCLTAEIVMEISKFANDHKIPLFVDPKYNAAKYRHISGKAILPNLKEWCSLVGETDKEAEWRNRVRQSRDLSEMADLCFSTCGNFEYYIVTCDMDGIVFIAPSIKADDYDRYIIYKIPPHGAAAPARLDQWGSGDVLTAVFAMELDRISRSETGMHDTQRALNAMTRANVVVACYREMPWQHMPTRRFVAKALTDPESALSTSLVKPLDRPRMGMKYLPKEHNIVLSKYETIVPRWFSNDDRFRGQLEKLRDQCLDRAAGLHLTLGALEGSGKTQLCSFLKREAEQMGMEFKEAPDQSALQAKEQIGKFIEEYLSEGASNQLEKRILAIDEALKRGFGDRDFALPILDKCKKKLVQLLLIDTGFFDHKLLDENREIKRRVSQHTLLPPNQRPADIPLIIGGIILEQLKAVEVRGEFLLGFTCCLLHNPSVGTWKPQIDSAVRSAIERQSGSAAVMLSENDIPASIREDYLDDKSIRVASKSKFIFSRGSEWSPVNSVLPKDSSKTAKASG